MPENSRAEFIRRNTIETRAPLVPEILLRLAHEDTELWRATAAWLEARDVPPPFWAFAWPGGQALARFLLDHHDEVKDACVVDFGSGSGIVAIAAMLAGARAAIACDTDAFAREAIAISAAANHVVVTTATSTDAIAFDARVVLVAADVFYDRQSADDAHALLLHARSKGARVWVADPRRPYFSSGSFDSVATFDVAVKAGLESQHVMTTDIFRMR